MKRTYSSIIKKPVIAFGLSVLLTIGMAFSAYAAAPYDLGYEEAFGEDVSGDPVDASEWYGTYATEVNGVSYGIEIAPCWDNPDVWSVTAIGIAYPNGVDERTSWIGTMMPNDPSYYTSLVMTPNGDDDVNITQVEDNSPFNMIRRMNYDTEMFDVGLQRVTGNTSGSTYLIAYTDGIDYGMISDGAPATAFLGSGDDGNLFPYTKISDSYGLTFIDWGGVSVPNWYWSMTNGGDPIIVNWNIQSNTPAGQAPIDRLTPAIYDWYYTDNAG